MTGAQWIDPSTTGMLACCNLCGWRDMRSDRMSARAAITNHVRFCHPDDLPSAQRAENQLRNRHG
jgi:hypothetical protein